MKEILIYVSEAGPSQCRLVGLDHTNEFQQLLYFCSHSSPGPIGLSFMTLHASGSQNEAWCIAGTLEVSSAHACKNSHPLKQKSVEHRVKIQCAVQDHGWSGLRSMAGHGVAFITVTSQLWQVDSLPFLFVLFSFLSSFLPPNISLLSSPFYSSPLLSFPLTPFFICNYNLLTM